MPAPATEKLVASAAAAATVEEAVGRAAAGVERPGLVLFFPTRAGAEPARAGAAAEAQRAAGCATAGMSASAVMSRGGPLLDGCSALALDAELATGLGVAEHASADPRTAALEATSAALASVPAELPHRAVLVFADTRSGDQADAVAGAYRAAGPLVPLAGGGAGGPEPAQFAEGRELRDAVVAVALGSKRPLGVGIADGCRALGAPSIVTRAESRTVLELDGRRADEVFLERLGYAGAQLSDAEFEALAVVHPLGQPELSGDRRLRHIRARSAGGGLVCATSVPEHAAVEYTEQSEERIVRSAWEAVSAALEPLGGEPARAALVFDCAGRKRALEDRLAGEVKALAESFGAAVPLAGAYTHGEIGRVRGAKGDRNHAVVVLAIG